MDSQDNKHANRQANPEEVTISKKILQKIGAYFKVKENSKQKWKNRSLIASLEFALTGIVTAFKEEANLRKHAVSAGLVVVAGLIFRISTVEWLFLLLSIFLVVTLEIVNSAIENVVDLASDYHFSMLAKNAKDMAAGAVLMMSFFAVLVGLIIFIPKIWAIIF